jgi:iron complex outermembrane recepter protein
LLAPYNVTAARFFINGVDTTTKGVDVVANYRIPTGNYGRFNLSLAWNNNTTEIDRLPSLTNSPLSPQPVLFARIRQQILTSSAPENKGTFAVDWTNGAWTANARATYYGNVVEPAALATNDIPTGDHTLIDLSASYRFQTNTVVTIGADNVLDEYPDATPANLNVTSGNGAGALAFTRFSPFGFNGRYLYARVSQSF